MTLLSKAQFARAVNVGKSRVTAYLKTKLIDGDAVVGEGRFAKIDLEKARAQLREQRLLRRSSIWAARAEHQIGRAEAPDDGRRRSLDRLRYSHRSTARAAYDR